jgi:hypothetical protein
MPIFKKRKYVDLRSTRVTTRMVVLLCLTLTATTAMALGVSCAPEAIGAAPAAFFVLGKVQGGSGQYHGGEHGDKGYEVG